MPRSAVDQFTRAPNAPENAEHGEAFLRSIPDREWVSELDQARAYLQRRADVDRRRLVILGTAPAGTTRSNGARGTSTRRGWCA
jgi:dienelactone hydrolase